MPEERSKERPRARRFAKACDHCHQKKVKCDAATPSCLRCTKHGLDCTYTRAEPDLMKPRRTARQLDVVYKRLQQTEGLLEEARKVSGTARNSSPNETNDDQGSTTVSSPYRGIPSATKDILQQPIPHVVLAILWLFLEQVGHVFPIYDKMPFINSVIQPSARQEEDTVAIRTSVHAAISGACRMANFAALNDRSVNVDQEADDHLKAALRHLGALITAPPRLLVVQALLCITISMSMSPACETHQVLTVLAPATRMALLLDLHKLDAATDLTVQEHMLRLRVFWTLYILDKDLSLQLRTPSAIPSDDWFVSAPQQLFASGIGLIKAELPNEQVNVFEARQKLAGIQDQVYTLLYAFRPRFTPYSQRVEAITHSNTALLGWSMSYLPSTESMSEACWPPTVYIHIVRLQLTYFQTLVMANPSVARDASAVEERLNQANTVKDTLTNAFRAHFAVPSHVAEAARTAYKSIRSIKKGGPSWLAESLHTIFLATLVVLQNLISEPQAELAQRDLGRAESWIELMGVIADQVLKGGLGQSLETIAKLYDIADHAVQSR